ATVSVRPLLSRVSASPRAMWPMRRASKGSRSPTTLKRMPLSWSLPTSCSSARRKSCIRKDTSSGGRRQFSLEKAKSVRYSTPALAQARTVSRTASTPLRCPATRGRNRFFAQRPLPSMMIATCRGTSGASGMTCVEDSNWVISRLVPRASRLSYGHQVLLFFRDELVDILDRFVGHRLDFLLGSLVVVLAHLALLEERLHVGHGVAADVAHRHLRVLALVLHDLGELLPALLGERGHRDADHVAGSRRVHA